MYWSSKMLTLYISLQTKKKNKTKVYNIFFDENNTFDYVQKYKKLTVPLHSP